MSRAVRMSLATIGVRTFKRIALDEICLLPGADVRFYCLPHLPITKGRFN